MSYRVGRGNKDNRNDQDDQKLRGPEREEGTILSLTLIQVILLILVAAAVSAGQLLLAMVLLGMVLLAAAGRIWARMTARKLTVRLRASKTRMFPGDEAVLTYEVKNQKALPVLWVDVIQPLAAPVCMGPVAEDGQQRIRKMSSEERMVFRIGEGQEGLLFQERCSMIGSYRTAAFDTRWRALQRGVYTLENTRIYTGDGFGLTRYRLPLAAGSQRRFVVYPAIVPVDADQFMKNLWEGESGARGVMEDPSVIKLTRPYENSDSLKRINWRLLARGQGLAVNQYEVISPRAIHFIFDGESFRGHGGQVLEDVLSILASLILRLSERGMDCGFTFPKTDTMAAVNLFVGRGEESAGGYLAGGTGTASGGGVTGDILYRMAAYQLRQPVIVSGSEAEASGISGEEKRYLPSVFPEEELLEGGMQIGAYYYITYDKKSAAASSLLPKMNRAGIPVEVLTYEELKKIGPAAKARGCDLAAAAGSTGPVSRPVDAGSEPSNGEKGGGLRGEHI